MQKVRRVRLAAIAILSLSAAIHGLAAQNTSQPTAKLRGQVLDTTGAAMALVDVRVFQGDQLIKQAPTSDQGDFEFDLPPGEYRVEVDAEAFKPFRETVRVAPGMAPFPIRLSLQIVETVVEVRDEANSVAVSLDSSLGATTLAGEQLQDLPDNEDDLAAYLQTLAAAKGGVDQSVNFIVDGFNNGRLPPRDQIQQIIIEDNPFSAEGGGGQRVRIITRPGSGDWRGGFSFQFRDESLNAKDPSATNKPSSQRRTYSPQFSGPLVPGRVTLNFQGSSQENESEGRSIRAITPDGLAASGIVSPSVTRQVNPRFTIFLNQNNTLNLNFNYSSEKQTNQGGGFTLVERGSTNKRRRFSFQAAENMTIGKVNNELRFQIRRDTSESNPFSTFGPYAGSFTINVADAFNGGPSPNRNTDRQTSFQFADQLRTTLGKFQINSGIQFDYQDRFSEAFNNYVGTFEYASLHDYCYAYFLAFGSYNWQNCLPTQALVEAAIANGETPSFVNSFGTAVPITGTPTRFTRRSGDATLSVNQAEFSAYFEAVVRATEKLAVQMGLRYQAQQHLKDYNNLGPRLNVRYQLAPATIVSVGSGIIYGDGFSINNWENLLRNDGSTRQFQTELVNPLNLSPWSDPALFENLGAASLVSLRTRAPDFVSPYNVRTQVALDQRIAEQMGFNITYENNRGLHLLRTRNINAPLPECAALSPGDPACRPDPSKGIVNQYESTGKSWANTVSFSFRTNFRKENVYWFNLQGSYTLGFAKDDAGAPSNNYNLAADWGRSSNDQRHRFQSNIQFNYQPWGLGFQLNPSWNSGRPYNVTTGTDDNFDGVTNDRPAGEPRNSRTGPSNYNLNASISKTFFLRRPPEQQQQANNAPLNAFAEPQRGGGGGGGGGGGNFGGFGGGNNQGDNRGDFPQGGFGDGQRGNRGNNQNNQNWRNNGPRIQFRIQANNLLNHPQRSIRSGVLTSPFFEDIIGNGSRTINLSVQFQDLF